ncbi:1565_t:CDS:2, partial [Gigaspora margarita]
MKDEAGLIQKEGGHYERSDIRYYSKTKDKKVKHRAFGYCQKLVKQGNIYEIDNLYDASRYCQNGNRLGIIESEISNYCQQVSHWNLRCTDAQLRKNKNTEEKGEMIKSKELVETDNASCRVIDEFNPRKEEKNDKRIHSSDSPLGLLLRGPRRGNLEENKRVQDSLQDSADMDCTSRMKLDKVENDDSDNSDETIVKEKNEKETCLDSSENNKLDDRKIQTYKPRKEKKETVLTETEEIVDAKSQEENNYRALTEDEEEGIEGWYNNKRSLNEDTLDRAYCQTITKVKKDENGFEKALANQDELLKVEVKDAEALVLQNFRRDILVQKNLEAVNESKNNHIQPEDQFQKTIVQSMYIESNSVSKMVHDEEEESSDLHESYEEDKNSEVVISEVGSVRKCMNIVKAIYTEIVKLLFDPRGKGSVLNKYLDPEDISYKKKMFMR